MLDRVRFGVRARSSRPWASLCPSSNLRRSFKNQPKWSRVLVFLFLRMYHYVKKLCSPHSNRAQTCLCNIIFVTFLTCIHLIFFSSENRKVADENLHFAHKSSCQITVFSFFIAKLYFVFRRQPDQFSSPRKFVK